jgi:exonuclease SbcD
MKILHTSDWHVGQVLKGRDRYDEHAAVLGSIVQIARTEDVDLVLVAGNLFDTAAPSAKAQGLVMRTLLALGESGRLVIATAGDRDSPTLLEAVYRPALAPAGVHVLGLPRRPRRGGLLRLRTRAGEPVNIAALPFLSRQQAAHAAEALPPNLAEHALDYSSQIAAMVQVLTEGFTPDAANLVMMHARLLGAPGRAGQSSLPPDMFPPAAQYAALGHLHQQQEIPGPCPIFYCGSPLAVDFEDIQNVPSVLIVSAELTSRATTRAVPVTGGRTLRTLRGTLDEVIAAGEQADDAYLRVQLAEPARPGLGDLVRDKLPNALEVVLDNEHQPEAVDNGGQRVTRIGRSPVDVFGDYLAEQNIVDPRLDKLFAELLTQVAPATASREA